MLLRLKWIPRLIRWRNPFRKGKQEASDQYLGKSAKMSTFHNLTMAVDMKELAEADRESVAQFRKQKMGITSGDKGNKDAWVCDDMTINASRSGLMELLVGLAIGALGFWWWSGRQADGASPASADASATAEAEIQFYQRLADGTVVPIDISRLPPHLRPDVISE